MTNATLYRQHLATLDQHLADAVDRAARHGVAVEAVLFHAGRLVYTHRDDQNYPFMATAHFRRWVPLFDPDHMVLARPGRKPQVIRVAPIDYWEEIRPLSPSYWQDAVDLVEVASFAEAVEKLGPLPKTAYVGSSPEAAAELGIAQALIEPEPLMAPLDWYRAYKTDHEVAQIVEASRKAADAHRVGRKAFEAGASEREIYWAFLQAGDLTEAECSFEPIVALDAKASTLHYHHKRGRDAAPGKVLLLDAGAWYEGYASDITRTWTLASCDPTFRALVDGVDGFQRELVALVEPGQSWPEVHFAAHRHVCRLLVELKIGRGSAEELFDRGVAGTFMPHGLGHHLGLQVHDVGGRQATIDGGTIAPPEGHPFLRTTRPVEVGHVLTVEPGIYFVPTLLDALRAGPAASLIDWKLVERLMPYGGVRIEDDVLCSAAGPRDLTRDLIQGPRGV